MGILLIVYGLLCAVGGFIGFIKARSLPSMMAGGTSGVILVASGFFYMSGVSLAGTIGFVMTLVMCLVFGMRFLKTKKFMPSGMMLAISIAAALGEMALRG